MNSRRPRSGSPRKILQGPRPSPLKMCRDSHQIRKSALAVPTMPIIKKSQPTIIYMQSPEIIHAEVQDFMTLVQRLTGSSSDTRKSDSSENLKANHESTIHQASAATTSTYKPEENMGVAYSPNSRWTTMIDRNQENGSRASEPEPKEPGLSAVTSASTVFSPNFLLPSRLLNFSPTVFKDLPLFTPNSDDFFYSPLDFLSNF